ncbi:MAG: hypothetical protein HDT21_00060 [Ruminococcus sp.]|nr:hypothetical protein [Ruminococcus sp.]
MALTPEQKTGARKWNEIIKSNVSNAIGFELGGDFIAANYAPGFNYAIKQQHYNKDTLSAFNTLLTESDGVPVIKDVYSELYINVIGSLEYSISKADRIKINQEEQKHAALVGTIINLYAESELDDDPQDHPTIMYIMKRIKEVTGSDYLHLDTKTFPSLSNLCSKLSEYSRLASFTNSMQNDWSVVFDRIQKIKENITDPSKENGGLETAKNEFYIGWDKLPETETIKNDLENEGSSIEFSISTNHFESSQSELHFESDVAVKVPFNWIFNMKIDHEHEFDFSKYYSKDSSLDIDFKFIGVSTVAAVPTPISSNNEKGWFAADMLKEAAEKSGKDATGIRLHGSRYDPDKLFGKDGMLRRISTVVISQQPIITLTFSNFEASELYTYFQQHTNVKFNILGGLISGEHDNDFSCTNYNYDSSENTLTVTLTPPPLGGTGSLGKQTAYVLGGTAEYFPRG